MEEFDDTRRTDNSEGVYDSLAERPQKYRAAKYSRNDEEVDKKSKKRKKLDQFGREMVRQQCPHCSHHGYIHFPEIASYPTCAECGERVNPPRSITSHMRRHSGFLYYTK